MDGKQKGFTLIEILVVVSIIGVLAGLVVILIPKGQAEAQKIQCVNNVKQLTGLLVATGGDYPPHGGANLMLYLVKKGSVDRDKKDQLELLFCPGDTTDTINGVGSPPAAAYNDLNLDAHDHGHLTSYAGVDQGNAKCRVKKGVSAVLMADDSGDHHNGTGFVIGMTDGSAKFRDKVDDWNMDVKAEVQVGEGSDVEELSCLRVD